MRGVLELVLGLGPLFCSVLEFGPDPTPPTPLFQGAPGRLFPRAPALASPSRLGCCYLFIARAFMIGDADMRGAPHL